MKSLLLATLLCAPLASASSWEIDPVYASARFSVRHLMVADVTGTLGEVAGTVELNDKDGTLSTVEASVDARVVYTRNLKRDTHLRSKDFLSVKLFPTITFKSTRVEQAGAGLRITGDLTIRGVTRSVTLDATLSPEVLDPFDRSTRRGVKATATLKREDFGLTWNVALEKGGVLVGSQVQVTIEAELRKAGGVPQP